MFLVHCRRLMLLGLSLLASRVMAIAHGRILACSVLIALCRVFLLFGAVFMPSGIVVADLSHARGCRQKCCCRECRNNLHTNLLLSISGKKSGSRFG
jgi:hypothetical protein